MSVVSDVEMARNEVGVETLRCIEHYCRILTDARFLMVLFQKAFLLVLSRSFTAGIGETRQLASPTCKMTRAPTSGPAKMQWMSRAILAKYLRRILKIRNWTQQDRRLDRKGCRTPDQSMSLSSHGSRPSTLMLETTKLVTDVPKKYTSVPRT